MTCRNSMLVVLALAGCGTERPELPPVSVVTEPPKLPPVSVVTEPEPPELSRLLFEVVEGDTVLIPVGYVVREPNGYAHAWVEIGLEASYQTASVDDVLLMNRAKVRADESWEGTVEFGLRALKDGVVEGPETFVLRPREWEDETRPENQVVVVEVWETEIEVVITDGPPPCAGVGVRVGKPVATPFLRTSGGEWSDDLYRTEVTIDAFVGSEQVIEWLSPPDDDEGWRSRTFTNWRVEALGGRLRHTITAQWRTARGRPGDRHLEMQVCGGAGYGKFIRCGRARCAVHDEGF